MMLSASPNTLAKSSLEEMLESLRQKDECDRPKDMPPALPSRPNSRARLPSARRSLPTKFNVSSVMEDQNGSVVSATPAVEAESERKEEGGKRKEKDLGVKRNSFGSKKMRTGLRSESPYAAEKEEDGMMISSAKVSPVENTEEHKPESEWNNNVEYFIKKVTFCFIVKLSFFQVLGFGMSLLRCDLSSEFLNFVVRKV